MSDVFEEGLCAYLKAQAGISALIGARVFPMELPQTVNGLPPTLPAMAYTVISGIEELAHDGPAGLTWKRVQLNAIANTYLQAKALTKQLRIALLGYRGLMGTYQVSVVEFTHQTDFVQSDFEPKRYIDISDAVLWHSESTS